MSQILPFLPTQITGCQLWFDGADPNGNGVLPSNGASISTWIDKSSNKNNGTGTLGSLPVYDLTNKSMTFNGTQYLLTSAVSYTFFQTTFVVSSRNISASGANKIFEVRATPSSYLSIQYASSTTLLFQSGNGTGTGRNGTTTSIAGLSSPNIFVNQRINASTDPEYVINGGSPTTYSTNVGTLSPATNRATIGGGYDSGILFHEPLNGTINEIIYFNVFLSTTQRQQIEGYLAWKWGLQANLPANHPFKNAPPFSQAIPLSITPSVPVRLLTSSAFSPTQISGCQLWLDAADRTTMFVNTQGTQRISSSGQSVALWRDKSSQANNATAAANQPTVLFSGQNQSSVLNFNGAQVLNLDVTKLPTGSTPFSFFFIVRTTSSATQVYFTYGTSTNGRCVQFYFNNFTLANDLYGSTGPSDTTSFSSQYLVMSTTASPTVYSAYDNGNPYSTNDVAITLNTGASFAYIGAGQLNSALTFYLTGQIGEIICYNRVVTTAERQQIEGYLAWKWGITLGASQPYTANPFLPFPFPLFSQPSVGAIFNPRSISNCAVWLDANRVNGISKVANNTTISSWVNLVPGGSNFTQATVSRQPTFIENSINGSRPSLYFNSSNTAASIQFLFAGPNVQTTRDVSYFYVAQYTDVGGGDQTQIDQRKDINSTPLRTLKASQNQARDPAGNIYSLSFTSTPLVPTIRSYRDTLNTINGYYNGTLVSNSTSTYNQQAADNYGILMGCHFDAMNNNTIASLTFSKFYMAEFIMYNSYLTLDQQQQVEGYLAWKWGLQASLPNNHPWKLFPPPP